MTIAGYKIPLQIANINIGILYILAITSQCMPIFAMIFLIVTLSSIGLPGLNGFVGEFRILLGSFVSGAFSKVHAVLAATGVILAAVYMLWMFQRVMFGELDNPEIQSLKDLNLRKVIVLLPILLFIVWIGVYPKPFLNRIEKSVNHVLTQHSKSMAAINNSRPAVVLDTRFKGERE